MTRKIMLIAGATAALIGGAMTVSADPVSGFYLSGEGGASFLPNLDVRTGPLGNLHENFNTGYAFGGSAGYNMGNGTRLEIDSLHQLSTLSGVTGGGFSANGHLQSTSLMLNGQFDLMHDMNFTPYVGAGAGFQHIGLNVDGLHDADWKPAYQVEAGLRHDMTPELSVFGEYRFSQSEAANLSDDGVTAHQHFADHGLLAGITYRLSP